MHSPILHTITGDNSAHHHWGQRLTKFSLNKHNAVTFLPIPYSVSWWGGLGIQSFRWDENPDPDLDLGVRYKHNILTGPNLGDSVSRHGGST